MGDSTEILKNKYIELETQLDKVRSSRIQEKLHSLKMDDIIALKKINKEEEQLTKELKIAYRRWQTSRRKKIV